MPADGRRRCRGRRRSAKTRRSGRIRSTLSPRYRSKHFTDATSSRRSTLPRVVQGEGPPQPLSGISATTGGALARGRRKIDGRHRRRDDAMEVGARGPTGREAPGGAHQEGGTSKKEDTPSSDAPTSSREFAREATRTQPRLIARRTSPRRSPTLKRRLQTGANSSCASARPRSWW